MSNGRIIVLEGLDGCGKSTQLELAVETLKNKGEDVRLISFPNYESHSGMLVSDYLHGDIPCDGEIGAYAAGSLYAVDRYVSYSTDWKADYNAGKTIISGRYTTSNAIYQMTKLDLNQRDSYLSWLWDYEHNKLGIPKPDLVIFLDMPLEVSQKLLSKRYKGDESKKDIHESNLDFMRKCRDSAIYTAQKCGWKVINCSDGAEPLPIDDIHRMIMEIIEG